MNATQFIKDHGLEKARDGGMKYKIGDSVFWLESKMKLTISRIHPFIEKYSCVCADGSTYGWFYADELKPIMKAFNERDELFKSAKAQKQKISEQNHLIEVQATEIKKLSGEKERLVKIIDAASEIVSRYQRYNGDFVYDLNQVLRGIFND